MTSSKICFLILILATAFCWTLNTFATESPTGMTLYVDSILREKGKSQGALRFDLGQVSLSELSQISLKSPNGVELLPSNEVKSKLWVFVPRGLDHETTELFLKEVKAELNKRFNITRVRLKVSYLDAAKTIDSITESNNEIRTIIAKENGENNTEFLGNAMIDYNDRQISILSRWKKAWADKIATLKWNPKSRDMMIGSLLGSGRSIPSTSYWLSVTGTNPFGITQSIVSILLDQFFARYAKVYNDFKADHKFPLWKESSIVSYYNRTLFLKALVVSQLTTLTISSTYRTLSYLHDPISVASPLSFEFLASFAGIGLINTPLSAASAMGVRALHRKGYISARTEFYLLNAFGQMATLNTILLGSGNMDLLPIGLAIEWTSRSLLALAGKALPTKGNRIYILHPAIKPKDKKAIRYTNGLRKLFSQKDLEPERFRAIMSETEYDTHRLSKLQKIGKKAVELMGKVKRGIPIEAFTNRCKQMAYFFYHIPF